MTNAEWAILGVIVGTIGTGFFNWLVQCQKFKHEKEMYWGCSRLASMLC